MAQIIIDDKSTIEDYPFEDEVHDMADFIVAHPEILGPDVRILARELQVPTVAGQKRMDFLAFDNNEESGQIVIVELKKSFADEKVLLQTLRYANWIKNNPDSVRYQIKKQGLKINAEEIDAEKIDADSIKVIIVAPKISQTLAELCEYITAFDFEFIELQRFKDTDGKVYAVTDRLEFETAVPAPARGQRIYDLKWYEEQGFPSSRTQELNTAIEALTSICDENSWDLGARYVKWSVRFQTPGGRNAFFIDPRKAQDHHIRFCLGDAFDIGDLGLPESVQQSIHHKNGSKWWEMDLVLDDIKKIIPLLGAAYQNIAK